MTVDFRSLYDAYNAAAFAAARKRDSRIQALKLQLESDIITAEAAFSEQKLRLNQRKHAQQYECNARYQNRLNDIRAKHEQVAQSIALNLRALLLTIQRFNFDVLNQNNAGWVSVEVLNNDARHLADLEVKNAEAECRKMSEEALQQLRLESRNIEPWHNNMLKIADDLRRSSRSSAQAKADCEWKTVMKDFELARTKRMELFKKALTGCQNALAELKAL